ncbi:MAG: hypothetical protein KKI08_08105 [Armatimonadetes bacterium]|nr:hypothetical protein [Armatimonadota bacterium]
MSRTKKSPPTLPRRGRPPVLPPEWEEEIALTAPHVQTRRGLQNVYYRSLAVKVLANDPRCAWLDEGSTKNTILDELGRFKDPAAMRQAALAVCRMRPRVSDAVVMLRRWRTGTSPPVDSRVLAAQLENVTTTYLQAHPGVTWGEVQDALDSIMEKISEKLPEGEGGEAQSAKAIRRTMAAHAGLRLRDVVGPVDQAKLKAEPGVYLVVLKRGGRYRPLYAGNTADVQKRATRLSPEGWFSRGPIRFAVAYTGDMPGDERQAAENAVKEEFELDA